MSDEGGGHEEEGGSSWWEKAIGWGGAGLHVAEHAIEEAAPKIGNKLPFLGTAIGAGQFGYHAHEAANTADNGSYTNNEHWNHVGEATLGGASAAASWCPPAALYLGAGELATDAVGGLAGLAGKGINKAFGTHLDLGFSAGSVVGQAEHLAGNLSAEKHPIINGLMGACPLTAPIAAAANMGSVVTGAGKAIDAVGSGAKKAWNAVSDW